MDDDCKCCIAFSSRKTLLHISAIFTTAANLDFTLATYMVDEDSGSVSVCMELSDIPDDGLECDLVVPLDTESGKAGEHALL